MTPQHILKAAARFYGLTPAEITGPAMERRIAWPRFAAMSLSREYSSASLPRIGRPYHRHHATVLNAIARTEVICRKQPGFALLLSRLQRILEADMQIYISGPRASVPDRAAFTDAAEQISAVPGYVALNPQELSLPAEWIRDVKATPEDRTRDARRTCFSNLVGCHAIVMLKGWQESQISNLEHDVAQACGLKVYTALPVFLATCPIRRAAE